MLKWLTSQNYCPKPPVVVPQLLSHVAPLNKELVWVRWSQIHQRIFHRWYWSEKGAQFLISLKVRMISRHSPKIEDAKQMWKIRLCMTPGLGPHRVHVTTSNWNTLRSTENRPVLTTSVALHCRRSSCKRRQCFSGWYVQWLFIYKHKHQCTWLVSEHLINISSLTKTIFHVDGLHSVSGDTLQYRLEEDISHRHTRQVTQLFTYLPMKRRTAATPTLVCLLLRHDSTRRQRLLPMTAENLGRYLSGAQHTAHRKDFKLILMVKMETRHPVEGPFGREFPVICNHCRVMMA